MAVRNVYEMTSTRIRPKRTTANVKTSASASAPKEELMVIAAQNGWSPRSSLTMSEINKMGSLEFKYHELFSPDAVAAALNTETKPQRAPERAPTTPAPTNLAIKDLGMKNGWTPRELSYKEVQDMSATESAWHQTFNSDNWTKAFEDEEKRRINKKHIAAGEVFRMWSGHGTETEIANTMAAGAEFARRNPLCEETQTNAEKLGRYMREQSLNPTDVRSWQTAFHALVNSGEIKLAEVESADNFYKKHSEFHPSPNQVPPLIAARQAKAEATKQFYEQARENTASAGSTNVTTYPDQQSGFPSAPNKYSFRRLIDSLSAEEFQKRVSEDKQFADAVNRLK